MDKITIKSLRHDIPDRILGVSVENNVTVVEYTHGRLKIMPENRKPKVGYSLRKQLRD